MPDFDETSGLRGAIRAFMNWRAPDGQLDVESPAEIGPTAETESGGVRIAAALVSIAHGANVRRVLLGLMQDPDDRWRVESGIERDSANGTAWSGVLIRPGLFLIVAAVGAAEDRDEEIEIHLPAAPAPVRGSVGAAGCIFALPLRNAAYRAPVVIVRRRRDGSLVERSEHDLDPVLRDRGARGTEIRVLADEPPIM